MTHVVDWLGPEGRHGLIDFRVDIADSEHLLVARLARDGRG
jgi:hypothetical protein